MHEALHADATADPPLRVGRRAASRLVSLLVAAALASPACGPGASGDPAVPPYPDEATFLAQADRSRGKHDEFLPLVDPPFVPADEAPLMADDEMVIALDLGDAQVCYPIRYLNHHEIVEHRLAGRDLLVCWCPLCRTAAVHERTIDGRTLAFGHSGVLWNNAYLLYDKETGSLWHHYWGTAFSGAWRGRTLPRIPSRFLAYGGWRAEHPGTLVLRKPDPSARVETRFDEYDRRNAPYRFAFGVDVGDASRLWRLDAFPAGGVAEDEVGGVPVVVARDPAAATAVAYDRRVRGRTLSFVLDTPGDGDRPRLRERDGRRAWFLRSGAPVPGTGADEPLRLLTGSVWEESAWTLQHPRGTVSPPAAR